MVKKMFKILKAFRISFTICPTIFFLDTLRPGAHAFYHKNLFFPYWECDLSNIEGLRFYWAKIRLLKLIFYHFQIFLIGKRKQTIII